MYLLSGAGILHALDLEEGRSFRDRGAPRGSWRCNLPVGWPDTGGLLQPVGLRLCKQQVTGNHGPALVAAAAGALLPARTADSLLAALRASAAALKSGWRGSLLLLLLLCCRRGTCTTL